MSLSKDIKNKGEISRLMVLGVFLGALSILFSVIFLSESTSEANFDFKKIPFEIGQWKGEDVEVGERVYEILETKNVFSRNYFDKDGIPIHVSIVYAQDNRSAFHPPEICYEGSNYKLSSKGLHTFKLNSEGDDFTVNRLLLANEEYRMISYYWFMSGDESTANYFRQQLVLVANELKNNNAIGAMVKITTPVVADKEEDADRRAASFVSEAYVYISDMLK